MQYRLIASDLDGTLLNSRKAISPRNRAALAAARERGIVVVISTGRTAHSARDFSQRVGGGPVICCNGAAILDENGQYIQTKAMPKAQLTRLIQMGEAHKLLLECYTTESIVLDRPLAQVRAYLSWVRPALPWSKAIAGLLGLWRTNHVRPVRSLLKWSQRPDNPPVLKVMIIGEHQRLTPLAEQIRREMPGVAVTSSSPDNLEIMAAGVSKGAALEALGARLKIPRQAMIAFGDGDNDREMLTYAGVGIAMGNAEAGVKTLADRVTGTCDEDGVAQAVEELCLS